MNAVAMVERCLELQTDAISAPEEALAQLRCAERVDGFSGYPVTTWCDRCHCNHGALGPESPIA